MGNKLYDVQFLFKDCLNLRVNLPEDVRLAVDNVVSFSERQKGVLTVVITGFIYKYFHPEQDVRYHQSNMKNGYSGRSFDSKYITPFLRDNNFPSMSESGWLTRSLEQNIPYVTEYPGKISGKGLKKSFLTLYDATENYGNPTEVLAYLFQQLVKKRDSSEIKLSVPANLTILETLRLIKNHYEYKYTNIAGASRLPSIAMYAVYKAIIKDDLNRYKNKTICELGSHTASDRSTGSIGDIQINDVHGYPFEGVEIKAREITSTMIDIVYSKIQEYSTVERYYILSTHDKISAKSFHEIESKIAKIRSKHGCDVIVNGVYRTLKCFLRLTDSRTFIKYYTEYVTKDKALKHEHRAVWNEFCSNL